MGQQKPHLRIIFIPHGDNTLDAQDDGMIIDEDHQNQTGHLPGDSRVCCHNKTNQRYPGSK